MAKSEKRSWDTAIKRKRRSAGLTQEQVADALGIPLRSLQAYEEGEYSPPLDRAALLAELYECSIDDFTEPGDRAP